MTETNPTTEQNLLAAPAATEENSTKKVDTAPASEDANTAVADPNKAADQKKDEGVKTGAPEKYEQFVFPEDVKVNETAINKFSELAKREGLTQEAAQSFVSLRTELMTEIAKEQETYWQTLNTEWRDAAKNDKEIGGNDWQEKVAVAKQGLDKFGTDALKELLETTGTGNNPEFIRFFYRVGKAIGNDNIYIGKSLSPNPAPLGLADRLYTNTKKE